MRPATRAAAMLALVVLLAAGCGGGGKGASPEAASSGSSSGAGGSSVASGSSGADSGSVVGIGTGEGETVEVRVEIADDDAERRKGLMDRTALAEDAGMLFVFERERRRSFWMKDTLIPLSIAYIDDEGRIIDLQDMEPLDLTGHPSAEPAQYALEVNQGFFNERGVEVGDTVELPEA